MPTPRKDENQPTAEDVKKEAVKAEAKTAQTAKEEPKETEKAQGSTAQDEKVSSLEQEIKNLQAENEQLKEEVKSHKEKNETSESDLKMKSQIIQDLTNENNTFKNALEKADKVLTADKVVEARKADVAVPTQEKLRTVVFQQDHEFVVGTETINAKKGSKREVDIFVANKLAGRKIATIIN